MDVFSKFLHIVPLLSKTGKAITTAFQSIFKDPKYSQPIRWRPVWEHTDKGKESLNKSFQDMLRRQRIQVQICKNPDIKCSVVEMVHRTIRDKLYKFFMHKNAHRFVDVIPKFVICYIATVHSTFGMPPDQVKFSNVLVICQRMNEKRSRVPATRPKFNVDSTWLSAKKK
jgi:hypothetical protein